jgi:RNA polymerase-binding transcription factor
MVLEPTHPDTKRHKMLRDMLLQLRGETYEKIREFRRDQEQEAEPAPADEMDFARSSADVEMHASLISRQEEKLRFVDEALSRLDAVKYGACLGCREAIPLERLIALPFAAYCVDCQQKRNRSRHDWGEGTMIAPYDHQWTAPEEMEEPTEREYRSTGPEEEVSIRSDRPFGREQSQGVVTPARRR